MTAATVHADMRAAFRAALLQPGVLADLALVDWEGREFTPDPTKPWLRERMRPAGSSPRGLGRGGAISHRIVLAATPFRHRRSIVGTVEIEEDAGRVIAAFPVGSSLVYGTSAGTVIQAERASIVQEPDWLSLPVTITVLAYTAG